jgi:serine/threonine protein kinase
MVQGVLKICDLGLARSVSDQQASVTLGVGTPAYMPPEAAFAGRGKIDPKAWDVYSLGVMLWYMWVRETPYRGCSANQYALMQQASPSLTATMLPFAAPR